VESEALNRTRSASLRCKAKHHNVVVLSQLTISLSVMPVKSQPKVLLVLNHAPHYRESFLRLLGMECDLTVLANACSEARLLEPKQRSKYRFIELESNGFLRRLPVKLHLRELMEINGDYDVVIVTWDLHHIWRYVFPIFPSLRKRYVWSGHFYGSRSNWLLGMLRTWFVNAANRSICYSTEIRERLLSDGALNPVDSFNNSQVSESEITQLQYLPPGERLRLLFIGREQPRKRLDRLVALAARRPDLAEVTIAGVDVEEFVMRNPQARGLKNLRLEGPVTGDALRELFAWSDLVVNPGHLGLLVVNAGSFGRAIIVDCMSRHAPEVVVAREAAQLFIDWSDHGAVESLLESLRENRQLISDYSMRLSAVVRANYTIEKMVAAHVAVIRAVAGEVLDVRDA
jgi:glycosyltransferase involved in cell wall biosynthesis